MTEGPQFPHRRKPFTRFHGTHRKAREAKAEERAERERSPVHNQETHGLWTLKFTLDRLGKRALDPDTETGRALAEWCASVVQDKGGEENVSVLEREKLYLAAKQKLLLESIDGYIFHELEGVVNKRKRSLHPVVRERQKVADALSRYMEELGLERRERPVESIQEYMRRKEAEREEETS